MVLGWSPFRIVSNSPPCQPRWLPLLKIENSAKKSLKNYLLWNCLANWAQTMVEWSSDGPLWVLCPTTPPPLLKIENLAKNRLKIISSETTGPIGPKLGWNGLQVVIFQNCVCRPRLPSKMATIAKNRNSAKNHLKIISSETAGSIGPKLWWNGL